MKIKKSLFFGMLAAIFAFLTTSYISPYYIDGDQYHYRDFYKYCFYNSLTFTQQIFCYNNTLGSNEPVYFLLSKIANPYLTKDLFISISNSILAFLIVLLIFRYHKTGWQRYLLVALVLSNYYLMVLFFSAERLKFAFIFLIAALLASQMKKFIFFGLAMLTHAQSALLIAPYFISKILHKDTKPIIKWATLIASLIMFIGAFLVLKEHVTSKFTVYSTGVEEDGTGLMGMVKTSIFIILAYISTRKILPVIAGIPLIAISYFLGSDRIGMLAFILYLGATLYYKNKMDLILFIVMLYFSYKSIDFILNILRYGSGYAN